jgi:methionyl-tRNA synthetase
MNMEGRKISGSQNWGVWMLDALQRHDPDPLRYYLTITMPETRDSDWSWHGYVERNNNELVANWGNLVHRVLNMTRRYFDGRVPDAGELRPADIALLEDIDAGFESVGDLYDACKFRAATSKAMALATSVNQYLEEMSPWKTAKEDPRATAQTLYTALQAINGLKFLLAPVLPFTSQQLHELLGEEGQLFGVQRVQTYRETERSHVALTYDGSGAVGRWRREALPAGRRLPDPQPLFKKLDESVADEELARLGRQESVT